MKINLNDIKEGEIKAISSSAIAIRSNNKIKVFSRYCSHEGADLSLGYVRDNDLRCPWHNLPFCLETGVQPCQSLKNLKEYIVTDTGNGEFEVEL